MENRNKTPRFAQLFRDRMTSLEIATEQMAGFLRVHPSNVVKFQQGNRAPSILTIHYIAMALTTHWGYRQGQKHPEDKVSALPATPTAYYWNTYLALMMARTDDIAAGDLVE